MARTSIRDWSLVGLLAVSIAGLPWGAARAAAQERVERRTPPGADDPFAEPAADPKNAPSAPTDIAFGAPPAESPPADDHPFGGPASAPATKPPNDLELEHKIRQALERPTNMEFIETPLEQAVDYLKDLHGIGIQLDHKALEDGGIGSDLPVSRTLKGVSLGSALRLMLPQFDLTHVVRDGVLLVTTPAAVREMVERRVYDVGGLVREDADVRDVMAVAELVLETDTPASDSACSTCASCTTKSRILPLGNFLVVRASIAEHEALSDLLSTIRQKLSGAGR